MFGKQKKPTSTCGWSEKLPAVHSSICTGEKVAGFKDKTTGKFTEVMLLRTDADYQEFLHRHGIDPAEVKREW